MKVIYRSILAFVIGMVVAVFLFARSSGTKLNTISDGYCTKVAASQFSMWVEVRAKLRQSGNPLNLLNESDRRAVNSNPKLKSLADRIAQFQEVIMTTPIVNGPTDLEFKRIFEKLNELINQPEKNISEIERVKSDFVSALKEYAPDFMDACHNHVAAVTKNCQEQFAIGSEEFNSCADPKLKEKVELALALVPGYKVITAANSNLKETMNQFGGSQ
ncbi:MAG: hypothetical protein ACXVA9_13560 [Bdellovibrionales bacterium]